MPKDSKPNPTVGTGSYSYQTHPHVAEKDAPPKAESVKDPGPCVLTIDGRVRTFHRAKTDSPPEVKKHFEGTVHAAPADKSGLRPTPSKSRE